jgi:hypothetical protein
MLQVEIDKNLNISYILTLFDLQWLKLTFKQQNLYFFGISEQFSIRKSTISIYTATSMFDLHMRVFNLQGLGAPDKPKKKKKSKYAEIDFTSHNSFLRVRRDQFLPNCDSGLSKMEPFNDAYRASPSTSSLPTNPTWDGIHISFTSIKSLIRSKHNCLHSYTSG